MNNSNRINVNSKMIFPVNVNIIHKETNGKLLRNITAKNLVLKQYGLYSWVNFILGNYYNGNTEENFNNPSYNPSLDSRLFVPSYLAVGSNEDPLEGPAGTTTTTQITDTGLYHELPDPSVVGELGSSRIPLNRATYVEDYPQSNWLKVQYEAYIDENRFVGMTIGELGLMTRDRGNNAFARITSFEPFVKERNTVVQVIWEITIISLDTSNQQYDPVNKIPLQECIDKAINVLQVYTKDPDGLTNARVTLDSMIEPYTNNTTAMHYLLSDNVTQDTINNFLSKEFNSLSDTGLIPLIHKFDPNWNPSTMADNN